MAFGSFPETIVFTHGPSQPLCSSSSYLALYLANLPPTLLNSLQVAY